MARHSLPSTSFHCPRRFPKKAIHYASADTTALIPVRAGSGRQLSRIVRRDEELSRRRIVPGFRGDAGPGRTAIPGTPRRVRIVAGAGYIDETDRYGPEPAAIRNVSASVYAYGNWRSDAYPIAVQLGLAAESFESDKTSDFGNDSLDRSQLSPKLGVVWTPRPGTTIRAAALSSVHRPFVRSQTLEPTQVAGFNQFFSGFEQFYGDFIGTVSNRIGIALDQEFSWSTYAGFEVASRRLNVPSFGAAGNLTWREETAHAYLYRTFAAPEASGWLAQWQSSISAEFDYEKVKRPQC